MVQQLPFVHGPRTPTTAHDLMPRALRRRAFALNQCICFTIVPVVALLAWFFVPVRPYGFDGWRWVVLFGSVGAIAVWGPSTRGLALEQLSE